MIESYGYQPKSVEQGVTPEAERETRGFLAHLYLTATNSIAERIESIRGAIFKDTVVTLNQEEVKEALKRKADELTPEQVTIVMQHEVKQIRTRGLQGYLDNVYKPALEIDQDDARNAVIDTDAKRVMTTLNTYGEKRVKGIVAKAKEAEYPLNTSVS